MVLPSGISQALRGCFSSAGRDPLNQGELREAYISVFTQVSVGLHARALFHVYRIAGRIKFSLISVRSVDTEEACESLHQLVRPAKSSDLGGATCFNPGGRPSGKTLLYVGWCSLSG
jgi:hypothetical protein